MKKVSEGKIIMDNRRMLSALLHATPMLLLVFMLIGCGEDEEEISADEYLLVKVGNW